MNQGEKYNRIRPMKIWEILQKETDEDHPMGTEELRARLAECGIEAHRTTIYEDINLLNDWGYVTLLCIPPDNILSPSRRLLATRSSGQWSRVRISPVGSRFSPSESLTSKASASFFSRPVSFSNISRPASILPRI